MRHLRIGLVVLALLAVAFVLWPRDEPADAAPRGTEGTARAEAAPRAAPALDVPPAEQQAEKRIYAVTLAQEIRLDGEPLVEDALTARLIWLPIPGTSVVQAQLVDARLDGIGHELPSQADLESAVLLERDEGGRLAGLRFSPRTGEPARLLLTALHASTQFTPGDSDAYTVAEEDETGSYRATYTRTGARTVTREKSGYSKLHEDGPQVRVEGTTEFTLAADGAVEALRSTETTRTHSVAFGAVDGSRRLEVALVARGEASKEEISQARWRMDRYEGPSFVVASDEESDEALDRRMDEERAAGVTLEGLRHAFAETEGLPRRGAVGQMRADLIETAAALFRTDPGEARAAGRQLGAAGTSDAEANFLAGGLASAGTREAAHALADAITSPTATAEAQRQAAASLTLVGQADATTIGALQEASRSDDPTVRNMSTLALGAQARVLGEGGGAGGLDPIADLLREYERASDLDSRRMFLAAFGNSGDVRTLPHLRAALAEPALAPTAAFGLRFIPSPEADVLLQQVALEGAPPVRAAALRAAFFRDPGAWMPVLQLAAARETYPPAMDAIRAALARYEEAG